MNTDLENMTGYSCIPFKPLSKDPLAKSWPTKTAWTLWRNALDSLHPMMKAFQLGLINKEAK
jgi:hypothetical protein